MSKRLRSENRILLLLYAAVLTLLCSGFSPLIHFYSTDGSVFYSIGKAMCSGQVAYRDIFDHKGLWLYFFEYAAAATDAFSGIRIGVYLLETLFFFIDLLVVECIMTFFIDKRSSALLATLLFCGFSLNYLSYSGGNFTETYALTFQLISVLLIVKAYGKNKSAGDHPVSYMFCHGLCAGICLFLRMNLVAMWIPFGIVFSVQLLKEKRYLRLLQNYAALVLGVAAVTLPVALYGLANDCMSDLVFCMLTFNLSYVGDNGTLLVFLTECIRNYVWVFFVCLLLSVLALLKSGKASRSLKRIYILCLLFTLYGTFMGLRAYGHYFETLFPFLLPMFVWIGKRLPAVFDHRKQAKCAAIVCCVVLTLIGNMRLIIRLFPFETASKELYSVIDVCREQINADSQRNTLLTTGNYMQPYVMLDTYPMVKYPYLPGATYDVFPEPSDEMYREILSGTHRYIFGAGYFDGYWNIFGGERETNINEYISQNYHPISVSKSHGYVMLMKNTEAGQP